MPTVSILNVKLKKHKNMNYKMPNIKSEYLKMYKQRFLELNNLKIGDEVVISFRHHMIRSSYKGKPERYSKETSCKGLLKENNDGFLYAESLDNLDFYEPTNNGLTGRSRREWYKKESKKAVYTFGEGFIHFNI